MCQVSECSQGVAYKCLCCITDELLIFRGFLSSLDHLTPLPDVIKQNQVKVAMHRIFFLYLKTETKASLRLGYS